MHWGMRKPADNYSINGENVCRLKLMCTSKCKTLQTNIRLTVKMSVGWPGYTYLKRKPTDKNSKNEAFVCRSDF